MQFLKNYCGILIGLFSVRMKYLGPQSGCSQEGKCMQNLILDIEAKESHKFSSFLPNHPSIQPKMSTYQKQNSFSCPHTFRFTCSDKPYLPTWQVQDMRRVMIETHVPGPRQQPEQKNSSFFHNVDSRMYKVKLTATNHCNATSISTWSHEVQLPQ